MLRANGAEASIKIAVVVLINFSEQEVSKVIRLYAATTVRLVVMKRTPCNVGVAPRKLSTYAGILAAKQAVLQYRIELLKRNPAQTTVRSRVRSANVRTVGAYRAVCDFKV